MYYVQELYSVLLYIHFHPIKYQIRTRQSLAHTHCVVSSLSNHIYFKIHQQSPTNHDGHALKNPKYTIIVIGDVLLFSFFFHLKFCKFEALYHRIVLFYLFCFIFIMNKQNYR